MGKKRNGYNVLAGRPEGEAPLENLDVNGTILKWLLQKQDGERTMWTAIKDGVNLHSTIHLDGVVFD
jgi:hypothetical protein